MYFKRINDTTINCVITPEDLHNNGIRIDDLFERKKEAMDYLRAVIVQAAKEENFDLGGEYASMRVTVLPDHSISLTLSENKNRVTVNDLRAAEAKTNTPSAFTNAKKDAPSKAAEAAPKKDGSVKGQRTYGFVHDSMDDAIQCSRQIANAKGVHCTSSLYLDEEYFTYYLFLENTDTETTEFEKMVLSLNEFGDFFNEGPAAIAFIREHGKCIVKDNAAQVLAAL